MLGNHSTEIINWAKVQLSFRSINHGPWLLVTGTWSEPPHIVCHFIPCPYLSYPPERVRHGDSYAVRVQRGMSNVLFLFPSGWQIIPVIVNGGRVFLCRALFICHPCLTEDNERLSWPLLAGVLTLPLLGQPQHIHCKGASGETKYKHFVYNRLADKRCTYMAMGSW